MSKEKVFEFSKVTNEIREAVRKLIADRAALVPKRQKLLADDSTDSETLARKVSEVDAHRDVLTARLERKRDELHSAMIGDLRDAVKQAEAAIKDTRRAWGTARDRYSENCIAAYGVSKGKQIATDQTLEPRQLRVMRSDIDFALGQNAALSALLNSIDAEYPRAAALPTDGSPVNPTPAWYRKNAAKLCPELKD